MAAPKTRTRSRITKHGLTSHERIELDLDLSTAKGWAEFVSRIRSTADKLDQIEGVARKILRQADLPDDLRLHEQGAGRWLNVVGMVKDKPHTQEWFAAELLFSCHSTRGYLEAKNTEEAASSFGRVMQLWTLAEFKEAWEPDAVLGVKAREGRAVGSKASARRRQKDHDAVERKVVHALDLQRPVIDRGRVHQDHEVVAWLAKEGTRDAR